MIWPLHGTEDLCFRPVGFANITAIPASTERTRMIQNRAGMGLLIVRGFVIPERQLVILVRNAVEPRG